MCRSKNIRFAATNYLGRQHYFVTICCFNRSKAFAAGNRCSWFLEWLRSECATRNFGVHAYCLMPDHVHFLTQGLERTSDLLNLMKSVKLKTSRTYARQTGEILWQRKFYDHVLRPNETPEAVAWYIWSNPVRKGLSPAVYSYPFNGSFTLCIPKTATPTANWLPPWRKQPM